MTIATMIFMLMALVTLGSALMVVTSRRMMYAALWLMLALFAVAVIFVLLDSSFFAIAQVIVYIGAISILIIFAIMLTREAQDDETGFNKYWLFAGLAAVMVFGLMVFLVNQWTGFWSMPQAELSDGALDIVALGKAFTEPDGFVIPFEAASVLLLAAMIGAVYLAKPAAGGKQ